MADEGEIFAPPYGTVVEAEDSGCAARRGVKRSAREEVSSVGEALAVDPQVRSNAKSINSLANIDHARIISAD